MHLDAISGRNGATAQWPLETKRSDCAVNYPLLPPPGSLSFHLYSWTRSFEGDIKIREWGSSRAPLILKRLISFSLFISFCFVLFWFPYNCVHFSFSLIPWLPFTLAGTQTVELFSINVDSDTSALKSRSISLWRITPETTKKGCWPTYRCSYSV